jgi:multiple sugar transport system substrate-binding protein
MAEIEFSFIADDPVRIGTLQSALTEFEGRSRVKVRARVFPWATAWEELFKIVVSEAGPDVSEIGTTWLSSLVSMNALRPFSGQEVAALGGPSVFVPAAWQSGSVRNNVGAWVIWAIPYTTDPWVLYYRRDLLAQAGIDEQAAFQTLERLEGTLHRLQESGMPSPWVIPTVQSYVALHALAHWVWGAGGHFIRADGKRTRFNEPEARAGMLACFRLHRYIAPAARNLDAAQVTELFRMGGVAVALAGHWLLDTMRQGGAAPVVSANLGLAIPPGVPFVGGTGLVLWRHCRHVREAVELVRFLSSDQAQAKYGVQIGLPTRLAALERPPFTTDPGYKVIGQSLRIGRGFQATYMWGLVEEKLTAAVAELRAEVFANPDIDLEAVIAERMGALAARLDSILSG